MKATLQCTKPYNALRIATQTELRIAKPFTENKIYIEQQITKTTPPDGLQIFPTICMNQHETI